MLVSTMVYDLFRSKRLQYIPIEDTKEHDDFLLRLRVGGLWANAAPILPTPGGPENSKKEARDLIAKARVPMYICLPAASEDAKTAPEVPSSVVDGGAQEAREQKPRVIGLLTLSKPSFGMDLGGHHADGSAGLNLLQEYTGKGYGGEALEWLLWYGFVIVGLHRMGIATVGWNKGARRLYERTGFVLEGVQRQKGWFMGGWHDFILLGMLRSEWLERQKEKGGAGLPTGEGLDSDAVAKIMGCQ